MIRTHPNEITRWRLYTAQIAKCLCAILLEKQDTQGACGLTFRRSQPARGLAVYEVVLVFSLPFGEINNQGFHKFKLMLSFLKLPFWQSHTCR